MSNSSKHLSYWKSNFGFWFTHRTDVMCYNQVFGIRN